MKRPEEAAVRRSAPFSWDRMNFRLLMGIRLFFSIHAKSPSIILMLIGRPPMIIRLICS